MIDFEEIVVEMSSVQDCLRWVLSVLNRAEIFLGHGTDNTWDETLHLVLPLLNLPLDLTPSLLPARLTLKERQRLAVAVRDRVEQRIPTPYITQCAWFAGLSFYVDERVLIPRSPFAEIIEQGFSPWLMEPIPERILELCTGSACMAIACAYQFPQANIVATDISQEALAVAQKNVEQHAVTVELLASDVFEKVTGQYDVIIANPPYVSAEDYDQVPQEFTHEPRIALITEGVPDGLAVVRKILNQAAWFLTEGGQLFIEVGCSRTTFEQAFPDLAVIWLELERGGEGLFVVDKATLEQYMRERSA